MQGHADTVHSVSWSADGAALVTACEDMLVRVFDVADVTNRDPKFRWETMTISTFNHSLRSYCNHKPT